MKRFKRQGSSPPVRVKPTVNVSTSITIQKIIYHQQKIVTKANQNMKQFVDRYIVSFVLSTCALFICKDIATVKAQRHNHIKQKQHLRLHQSSLNANINKNNKKQTLAQFIDTLKEKLPLDSNKDHFRLLFENDNGMDNGTVNEHVCTECGKALTTSDRYRYLFTDITSLDNTTIIATTTSTTTDSLVVTIDPIQCISNTILFLRRFFIQAAYTLFLTVFIGISPIIAFPFCWLMGINYCAEIVLTILLIPIFYIMILFFFIIGVN
jgi:hypothetical protein